MKFVDQLLKSRQELPEKSLHQITRKEDFYKENNLEDREFTDHVLRYWME